MIKILDQFVSDKIAAGEVIERPLSIVKELVENSIDAGASQIIIEIKNGGKSYIRVTDNGAGIPEAEVELAFLRHATSKISGLSDLEHIDSLGFRGEALASITAISRLTIYTKTSDATLGIKLKMHAGQKISLEKTGMNNGTTMVIEDVFYNTPARRKFMKSDAREASIIIDTVQKLAIYYANISFRLINNGQTVLSTRGNGNTKSAIEAIYPTYRELIEIKGDFVNGFISDPGSTKSNKRGQIFFVNGRYVKSNTIEKGIEKGYGDRIFSGYPIAILFIEVDPKNIDVNIHPNKKDIKFLEADLIIKDIEEAIKRVIRSENSIPAAIGTRAESTKFELKEEPLLYEDKIVKEDQLDIRSFLKSKEREPVEHKTPSNIATNNDIINIHHPSDDTIIKEESFEISLETPYIRPFDFEALRLAGYIFDTYIITESADAIYLLDQHAAHERIMYERFINQYNSKVQLSQPMLISFTIETSSDIYAKERDWMDELRRLGFDIDDFGNNTFIIRGIPTYMEKGEAEIFARTFIEDPEISESKSNKIVVDKLIMRSCKAAVKGNNRLSEREIKELLEQLSECVNPFSCPHGRPTFIKMTKYEISRAFKR